MKEWSPTTWYVVSCILFIGAVWWTDEGGWYLGGAAICAWLMSGITALERRLWP